MYEEGDTMGENVRDKFLTGQMKECWHVWYPYNVTRGLGQFWRCSSCSVISREKKPNNNFSTNEGYERLRNWASHKEWWAEFVVKMSRTLKTEAYDQFADMLAIFLIPKRIKEIDGIILKRVPLFSYLLNAQIEGEKSELEKLYDSLKKQYRVNMQSFEDEKAIAV